MSTAEQATFGILLVNVCVFWANNATEAMNQGYNMARRFLWIDKGGLSEIFSDNAILEGIKVAQNQILIYLHTYIMEKDTGSI